jgi:DNA-binding SARP family transcriptional activator
MACEGELHKLIDAVERGRGGCLVIEGSPAPTVEVGGTSANVLRHQASAEEQLLTHAALATLCAPLRSQLGDLPGPLAAAVDRLLVGSPDVVDGLTVAAAFRDLLHAAAAQEPLLVVVEHAHLLDRGSAAALGFAARGAAGGPLGVVVTQDAGALGRLDLPFALRCRSTGTLDVEPSYPASPGSKSTTTDRDRRSSLGAASALLDAGELGQALAVARDVRRDADESAAVAEAELLLGRIDLLAGDGPAAAAHLRAAMDAAPAGSGALAAEAALLLTVPAIVRGRTDRVEAALDDAATKIDEAALAADHPLRALHSAARAALDVVLGRPVDEPSLTSLAQRLAASEPANVSLAVNVVALPLAWLEHHRPAAALLRALIASLRARGSVSDLATALCALSVTERRAGRPSRALVLAGEARDLAQARGLEAAHRFALSELANVHAIMGDLDRCRSAAHALFAIEPAGRGVHRTSALSALATAELWAGDPGAAVELLEPLVEPPGGPSQAVTLYLPTLITAYVAVGRHDDASRLLADLQALVSRPGRTAANVARCQALLAPADVRDDAFAAAVDAATGNPLAQGFTRLLHARRLLADGATLRGAVLLRELAELADEDLLGVARAARLTLGRLGMVLASGDPAWATVERGQVEVALATIGDAPPSSLAERLGLSAAELQRLHEEVAAVVGYPGSVGPSGALDRPRAVREIRVLGGLSVVVDGHPLDLPAGAASTAVALLALRRAVHVEELAEVLWPGVGAEVARRRLRNVLARIRQAVGPILVRRGDRIVLGDGVVVDHHDLDVRARRALAEPPGLDRARRLAELVCSHGGTLLPEAAYEEWATAARRRAEVRYEELVQALAEERARP